MNTENQNENARRAMHVALRILSGRDHSRQELGQKLAKKGIPEDTVNQVLLACDRLCYLDDRRFAENMLNAIFQKGYGRHYLRAYLKKRGIDSEIIENLLNGKDFEEKESKSAQEALKKKSALLDSAQDETKRLATLYRYLYSRGFSWELIRRLLKGIGKYDPIG
jgi:regulatory protein